MFQFPLAGESGSALGRGANDKPVLYILRYLERISFWVSSGMFATVSISGVP
jgi:hypothetical protein